MASKKYHSNNHHRQNGRGDGYYVHEQPERRPLSNGQRLVRVFVEGYEDVAFWRGVFDRYESDELTFEVSVPIRDDLAKGKKVVLKLKGSTDPTETLLCVDSDFDYLFANQTDFAKLINETPNIFHTYVYSAENFLCYAPTLHNICVKATKNDMKIFDFELFFAEYSRIIYPMFLWYAYSAQINSPNIFTLQDFKSSAKINYLEVNDNGADTLGWLSRQVDKRLRTLRAKHPEMEKRFPSFINMLKNRGVTPENTYLFMQGHTLMDNVVMPVLEAVCEKLRQISIMRINSSQRRGVTLSNEQSNYNNSVQSVRDALAFNENFKDCYLYRKLQDDIEAYLGSLPAKAGSNTSAKR